MGFKKRGKKGVSPVVATVILITVVIILAIIIFLWSKSFMKEKIEKDVAGNKKRINEFCPLVKLEPLIKEGEYGVINKGNVPVYALELKKGNGSESEVTRIDAPDGSVNPGVTKVLGNDYNAYSEIKVIPVLLGINERGENVKFTCPEETAIEIK